MPSGDRVVDDNAFSGPTPATPATPVSGIGSISPSGPVSGSVPLTGPGGGFEDDGFVGPNAYSPMPKLVGDYQLISRLGGGSMAELYVARKVSQFGFVHRAVIKQVKHGRADFQQLQRMLLDEARATACFDHPNLVSIYDVGETDQGLYLALEYVEGTDLRRVNQKLRSRKEALPFELACFIVAEVLRGVHHAHTARGPDGKPLEIVHRDVNPSNVLVSTSGHVKLADFGVVRMRERIQPKTEPGLVKGKYAYLAPEYIAGEPCSVQTDVYAAGIMLFELLSGRECFTGSTAYEVMWKIVNKGVPLYRLQREGVPEDLQRLVARATSMVPERRYTSAQDMANALEAWLMRSQRHATPWVLSVFFHRHDLFQKSAEQTYAPPPVSTPPPPADARGRSSPPPAGGFISEPGPHGGADQAAGPMFPLQPTPHARGVVDDTLTPLPDLSIGSSVPIPQVGETRIFHPENAPRGSGQDAARGAQLPTQPALPVGSAPTSDTKSPVPDADWSRMPDANELVPPDPGPSADGGASANASAGSGTAADGARLADGEQPTEQGDVPLATHYSAVDTSDLAPPKPASAPAAPPVAPRTTTMVRSGKLEEHPAADVLEQLTADEVTGIIEFRCGLIWKRVLMTNGKPTGVTSNMGMELIGEHLVKARIITRDDLERALQNSDRLGKPLTFCLLEQGALTREALEIELGRNLAARLQEVLEWRWGTFEFTAQAMEPVEILPKLDLAALLRTARANRSQQDSAPADPTASAGIDDDTPQTKLKEALRVARSIAKSTGKGRVERPWRNPKP